MSVVSFSGFQRVSVSFTAGQWHCNMRHMLMQNVLPGLSMQGKNVWEEGMNFPEMTAELIITDCKMCREITRKEGRRTGRERERARKKGVGKEITTLAPLIINTSVIANRQVAENRQSSRETWWEEMMRSCCAVNCVNHRSDGWKMFNIPRGKSPILLGV